MKVREQVNPSIRRSLSSDRSQRDCIRSLRREALLDGNSCLFALTALLHAGLGIYGVISYIVSGRTHRSEFASLGAQRRNILRIVVRKDWLFAVAGAAVGLSAPLSFRT